MKIVLILLVVTLILTLWRPGLSFRHQNPETYAATGPAFDIKTQLNGPIISEGMIHGPNGRLASRFVADMKGVWEGNTGTLAESFRYDNGSTQERKWFLTLGENGAFTATADDIIGTARGQISGATLSMTYRIRLTETAGGHVLNVTDWLYLMENGTILNRSELRKFGVKVAELTATMRPAND